MKLKAPVSLVVVDLDSPVLQLVSVTRLAEDNLSAGSLTVPVTVPVTVI